MQSYYRRCKHCGSEYLYRINGGRFGMDDWISDYCPECQSAMDEALSKISKKFEPRWRESDLTIARINELITKADYQKPYVPIDESDKGWGYTVVLDGVKYNIEVAGCYTAVRVYDEYDLQNDCFTGQHWPVPLRYDVERHKLYPNSNEVKPVTMNKPWGMLCFMDMLLPTDKQTDNKQ